MQLNLTGMTEPPFFLYVETDTWQLHNSQQEYNLSSDLFSFPFFSFEGLCFVKFMLSLRSEGLEQES